MDNNKIELILGICFCLAGFFVFYLIFRPDKQKDGHR